jgi:hypothetical protein
VVCGCRRSRGCSPSGTRASSSSKPICRRATKSSSATPACGSNGGPRALFNLSGPAPDEATLLDTKPTDAHGFAALVALSEALDGVEGRDELSLVVNAWARTHVPAAAASLVYNEGNEGGANNATPNATNANASANNANANANNASANNANANANNAKAGAAGWCFRCRRWARAACA